MSKRSSLRRRRDDDGFASSSSSSSLLLVNDDDEEEEDVVAEADDDDAIIMSNDVVASAIVLRRRSIICWFVVGNILLLSIIQSHEVSLASGSVSFIQSTSRFISVTDSTSDCVFTYYLGLYCLAASAFFKYVNFLQMINDMSCFLRGDCVDHSNSYRCHPHKTPTTLPRLPNVAFYTVDYLDSAGSNSSFW